MMTCDDGLVLSAVPTPLGCPALNWFRVGAEILMYDSPFYGHPISILVMDTDTG